MKDIRILIADDDKEIRNLLKIYLERELYMVDTAINGDEAFQLFNGRTTKPRDTRPYDAESRWYVDSWGDKPVIPGVALSVERWPFHAEPPDH